MRLWSKFPSLYLSDVAQPSDSVKEEWYLRINSAIKKGFREGWVTHLHGNCLIAPNDNMPPALGDAMATKSRRQSLPLFVESLQCKAAYSVAYVRGRWFVLWHVMHGRICFRRNDWFGKRILFWSLKVTEQTLYFYIRCWIHINASKIERRAILDTFGNNILHRNLPFWGEGCSMCVRNYCRAHL